MQTINLNIELEHDLLNQAIQHFKKFLAEHHATGNMTYVDELGDTIELINGIEYVVPTQEDLNTMSSPKDYSEFTSLEDLKRELCIN